MDVTRPVPPAEPPPAAAGDAAADPQRVAGLATVAAGVLVLGVLLRLLPFVFGSGARGMSDLGLTVHRSASLGNALLIVVAIVAVLRARRAASTALVSLLVVVGVVPMLAGVARMSMDTGEVGQVLSVLVPDAVAAWWPAVLVLVVLAEVRALLPSVERSWRTTLWLAIAAGVAGVASAAAFGVMVVTHSFGVGVGFGGPLVAVVLSGVGLVAWSLGLLTVLHAVGSAARTRRAAEDPTFVPVPRPGVGALVVGAVAVIAFVQLGFTVLRGFF